MRVSDLTRVTWLLLALVTVALAGCSRTKPTVATTVDRYGEELRKAVSSDVHDETRKSQMLAIVDQVEKLHLRFAQETTSFVGSYRKLNADYDAERPAFEHLFADYEAQRIAARDEAIDLHCQLAALATATEWREIEGAEQKLYDEAREARQAAQGSQ